MHIENVTINVSAPSPSAAALLAALFSAPTKAKPAPDETTTVTKPPAIGQVWPGQGGIYAGLARGEDGRPDCHLILAEKQPAAKANWADATAWAADIEVDGHQDFALPTRFESALLYANLRDQFDTSAWYWTGTQYSDGNAWYQHFHNGNQHDYDKSYEARARAVRRFTA